MKKQFLFLILVFMTLSAHLQAQEEPPASFTSRFWFSLGPMISTELPTVSLKPEHRLSGASFGLGFEQKRQVVLLEAYSLFDNWHHGLFGYTDPMPDKLIDLSAYSVSYGYRVEFKWGSIIPCIGLSAGYLEYRNGHSDTTYAPSLFGGYYPVSNYSQTAFVYLGVPVSVRILTSLRHMGLEVDAYCTIHKYADMGFKAALLIGRISNYRKKKQGY